MSNDAGTRENPISLYKRKRWINDNYDKTFTYNANKYPKRSSLRDTYGKIRKAHGKFLFAYSYSGYMLRELDEAADDLCRLHDTGTLNQHPSWNTINKLMLQFGWSTNADEVLSVVAEAHRSNINKMSGEVAFCYDRGWVDIH